MRDRVVERLDRLHRQGSLVVENRSRDHHRQPRARLFKEGVDGEETRLHDQRVERRFGQQDIDAARHQRGDLLGVIGHHLIEGHVAAAGVLDVNAHRELFLGRPDAAGHEPRLGGVRSRELVGDVPREKRGSLVQLEDVFRQAELLQRERRCIERVGLDDIGARFEIGAVNLLDQLGTTEYQDLRAILEVADVPGEPAAPVVLFRELIGVKQRPHRAVEDHDPARQDLFELAVDVVVSSHHKIIQRIRDSCQAAVPLPFRARTGRDVPHRREQLTKRNKSGGSSFAPAQMIFNMPGCVSPTYTQR